MAASAGRVLPISRGDYAAGTTYTEMDYVFYNGSSYICKKTSTGNLPTDTEYWQIMCSGAVSNPEAMGDGYATCITPAATAAKEAVLTNFQLKTNGIVAVDFTYNVGANATLNINQTGAKPMWNRGAALADRVIKGGDLVTFIYDGSHFRIISIDRSAGGHTIQNPAGTNMAQRNNLKFVDSHLSDDETNDKTLIEVVKEVTDSQYEQATEDGLYLTPDSDLTPLTAQEIAYGNSNVKEALDGTLKNVSVNNPEDGQVIKYDTTTGKWKNSAIPTPATTLDTLTDVDITTPTDGQVLRYNGITQEWENVDAPATSPNPNLFLNPFFTINQRGATTVSDGKYIVDRWAPLGSTVYTTATIKEDGSIDCSSSMNDHWFLCQPCDYRNDLFGKELTLSTKVNGNIYTHTFTFISAKPSSNQIITIPLGGFEDVGLRLVYTPTVYNFGLYHIGASSTTINVSAAKLELGSVSTLHLDTAPDYTTELLKCQRYYYQVTTSVANQLLFPGVGATSATARCFIPLPTKMRATPTFSYSGTFSLQIGNTTTSCNSLSLSSAGDGGAWVAATVTSGVSSGQASILKGDTIGAYLAFSADL